MDAKQAMSSFVTSLLVLAIFIILPTDADLICPWCDKKMETDLMNCVYIEMISRPELFMMPLQDIDNIKWKLLSDSDSMMGMSYTAKKVAMDDKFVDAMAGVAKQNNGQSNPAITGVVSELAGNCYSSVTGYDANVVIQDIKRLVNEKIEKSSAPLGGDTNSAPNSGMPYSAKQNPQSNFQPSPQIQPSYVNDAPFNPPVSPPANSFNNPSYGKDAPFNPPGSPPVNSFNNPSYGNDAPFNSPVSQPANSFNNPSYGNDAPFNPPGSSPVDSSNNPPFVNDAPFNPPASSPVKPSNNPSFVNNDAEPSENLPSNNFEGQGQAGLDSSRPDGSSGTSLQNDNESDSNRNSMDNATPSTTASPKSSSPSQGSKSPDSDSSDNSNWTTPSLHIDAPQKETTGDEKSDDEEPCDEKFKIALYEKLINDDRFSTFFGKLPVSATKPAVLEIMNHAFKKYGIQQHYAEFKTFWNFDSRTLNKESTVEDWDEVISKICKILFSRNNLLKGDCEEIGREIADYILDVLPGDPPVSSTQAPNQNDGNDNTSTESNTNSNSNSTTNASPENSFNSGNSTNSKNPSFPELHSKLADTFKYDGPTDQDSDDVPFSETLSKFEAEQDLETLKRAAESCLSHTGFDLKKFMSTMSNVTNSIQYNHPDWSRDKCEKEMYSETVAVIAQLLQDTVKSSNSNAQSQSSSNQPDSALDSSTSQTSDSGVPPNAPNDYSMYTDYPSYPGPGTDYVSDSAPQPQQDYSNYRDYPDGTGPVNVLPYGNQPAQDDWNSGLTQPSNFAPGPANTDYGNLNNGNWQNTPSSANQPYDSNYGSQDYGPVVPQPMPQSYPSQDYSAIPPANMNTQPYSGAQPFPVNQNTGFQQPPNVAPNSGFVNSPTGNNQFQSENPGNNYGFNAGQPSANPALPNGNSQNRLPQVYQNHDYGAPSAGPVILNGNTQPGFDSNYNSRFPDNGQAYPQW